MDEDEITTLAAGMFQLHRDELGRWDNVYGYVRGERGIPEVPEGARAEIKQIARMSVKNVLSLVVGSFAQNLSVVGYRRADAQVNDAAWRLWQRQRMDARQAEVHRAALTYGVSYVSVTPGDTGMVFRPRSPRQLIAVYDDPQVDAWPRYALETWLDLSSGKRRRAGYLIDEFNTYPLDLGPVLEVPQGRSISSTLDIQLVGEPVAHRAELDGRPVCPVVRFINDRDAEDQVLGEVEPLIKPQRAINNVNFDRLTVSRFGAFPQKVITGWTDEAEKVLKASASQVWTFDDPDVDAKTLTAASVDGYNAILTEMLEHVAMQAQISPAQVTGKMVNLSADALAAGEANQQRKLKAKRDSFGESWEQLLRLAAEMDGDPDTAADVEAEVVWRDTEARSFGAVVDGVVKLASQGVPVDQLLTMVPGLSQPQITAIRSRLTSSNEIVNQLKQLAATGPSVTNGADLSGL